LAAAIDYASSQACPVYPFLAWRAGNSAPRVSADILREWDVGWPAQPKPSAQRS